MKVIAVGAQKGGTGKTTTCAHLSVELASRGYKVVLIDMDEQESLVDWWNLRKAESPAYIATSVEALPDTLKKLDAAGIDFVFIDTPGKLSLFIREVIEAADLTIVPTRASPVDLRALGRSVGLINDIGCPMVFLLNAINPRTRIASDAILLLSQHGKLAPPVRYSNDFIVSMTDGRTAQELRANTDAAEDVRKLANYVLSQFGIASADDTAAHSAA